MKVKVTDGYVTQTFNDKGECISQQFTASDAVSWFDENGRAFTRNPSRMVSWDDENSIAVAIKPKKDFTEWYHPFDMIQPK